jgi:hypothetical protein
MSSVQLEGTIERKGFGTGAWALVTAAGETYELHKPPSALQTAGVRTKISGRIRDDIMSIAMIGPILEVQQFEVIA